MCVQVIDVLAVSIEYGLDGLTKVGKNTTFFQWFLNVCSTGSCVFGS